MVSMYYSDDLRATVIFQESVAGLGLPGWLAGSTGVRQEGDPFRLIGEVCDCAVANQAQTSCKPQSQTSLDDCFCRDSRAKVS